MKKFTIKYDIEDRKHNVAGQGEMVLSANFFPCKNNEAHKIYKLAVRWCSKEQIEELLEYLNTKLETAERDYKVYSDLSNDAKEKNLHDYKSYLREAKKAEKQRKSYELNINILNKCIKKRGELL